MLSEFKIYPASFSKYGREYEKHLAILANKNVSIFMPRAAQALPKTPLIASDAILNFEGGHQYA
jgi:hypothetical protein